MASSLLLLTLAVLFSAVHSLPNAMMIAEGEEAPLPERVRRSSDCIDVVYVFAHTSLIGSGTGTNNVHDIEIDTSTASYKSSLVDLPGDQADAGKGDLWKLSLSNPAHFNAGSTCIEKSDITSVSIEEDGNDGWRIDSIVTLIKTNGGSYEVLTVDMDVHQWIDGDGNPITQPGVKQIWDLTEV